VVNLRADATWQGASLAQLHREILSQLIGIESGLRAQAAAVGLDPDGIADSAAAGAGGAGGAGAASTVRATRGGSGGGAGPAPMTAAAALDEIRKSVAAECARHLRDRCMGPHDSLARGLAKFHADHCRVRSDMARGLDDDDSDCESDAEGGSGGSGGCDGDEAAPGAADAAGGRGRVDRRRETGAGSTEGGGRSGAGAASAGSAASVAAAPSAAAPSGSGSVPARPCPLDVWWRDPSAKSTLSGQAYSLPRFEQRPARAGDGAAVTLSSAASSSSSSTFTSAAAGSSSGGGLGSGGGRGSGPGAEAGGWVSVVDSGPDPSGPLPIVLVLQNADFVAPRLLEQLILTLHRASRPDPNAIANALGAARALLHQPLADLGGPGGRGSVGATAAAGNAASAGAAAGGAAASGRYLVSGARGVPLYLLLGVSTTSGVFSGRLSDAAGRVLSLNAVQVARPEQALSTLRERLFVRGQLPISVPQPVFEFFEDRVARWSRLGHTYVEGFRLVVDAHFSTALHSDAAMALAAAEGSASGRALLLLTRGAGLHGGEEEAADDGVVEVVDEDEDDEEGEDGDSEAGEGAGRGRSSSSSSSSSSRFGRGGKTVQKGSRVGRASVPPARASAAAAGGASSAAAAAARSMAGHSVVTEDDSFDARYEDAKRRAAVQALRAGISLDDSAHLAWLTLPLELLAGEFASQGFLTYAPFFAPAPASVPGPASSAASSAAQAGSDAAARAAGPSTGGASGSDSAAPAPGGSRAGQRDARLRQGAANAATAWCRGKVMRPIAQRAAPRGASASGAGAAGGSGFGSGAGGSVSGVSGRPDVHSAGCNGAGAPPVPAGRLAPAAPVKPGAAAAGRGVSPAALQPPLAQEMPRCGGAPTTPGVASPAGAGLSSRSPPPFSPSPSGAGNAGAGAGAGRSVPGGGPGAPRSLRCSARGLVLLVLQGRALRAARRPPSGTPLSSRCARGWRRTPSRGTCGA